MSSFIVGIITAIVLWLIGTGLLTLWKKWKYKNIVKGENEK